MNSSSTPPTYLAKQSGESDLGLRSCKGMSTAKKREWEGTDSKDAGPVRENSEGSLKQYLPEINEDSTQIIKQQLKDHQLKARVDQLICKNDNRPIKALWEALIDKATPDIELPMAIVMDPRCGIERRAEKDDNFVDSEGYNPDNSTPLMLAVRLHRKDVVEALLVAGADPSACDSGGRTAYLVAAFYGNVIAMDLLVRYGADQFAVSDFGSSALHFAALKGRAQTIQWLVELGASTEVDNDHDQTPFILTAHKGDVPSLVTLLNNGANLDAMADNFRTPLHCAIFWGNNIGAIETLVWEGASITAKDKSGSTPLEMFHQFSGNRYTDAEKARLITLLTPTEFSI